ncbi:MAG: PKD domain-containing protein, partial [Bacteroidetes bacterium]
MKTTLFLILSFCLYSFHSLAQCNANICPPGEVEPAFCAGEACVLCSPALLDGYVGKMPTWNVCTVPEPFCGSIENNIWFAFVAREDSLELVITPFNCIGLPGTSGMQAEIYGTTNCQDFWSVSDCLSPGDPVPIYLVAKDLTPGEVYYLMLDGWAADVCEFSIEVLYGGGNNSGVTPQSATISGPNQIDVEITGDTVGYQAVAEDAGYYIWEIMPASAGQILNQSTALGDAIVKWDTQIDSTVVAEICVTPYNECEAGPQTCMSVTIVPAPLPPTIICEGMVPLCESDNPIVEGKLPPPSGGAMAFPGCTSSVLNNPIWYYFIAATDSIAFAITPHNCAVTPYNPGMQGAIYRSCVNPSETAMALYCDCSESVFELASGEFIVGVPYFLLVDGCLGNICDFSIDVVYGAIAPPPPPLAPSGISGNDTSCVGQTDAFTVMDTTQNVHYVWQISPPIGAITGGQGTDSITIAWNSTGIAQLCVAAEGACDDSPEICMEVNVCPDLDIAILGDEVACAHTTEDYEAFVNVSGDYILNWTVNGGGFISSLDSNHITVTWLEAGPAEVCVEAVSFGGDTLHACLNVTVSEPLIAALESADTLIFPENEGWITLCLGDTLSLTAYPSDGQQILSTNADYTYNWDFGDGNTDEDKTIRHVYQTAGCFELSLFMSDADLCPLTPVLNQKVRVIELPQITLEPPAPDVVCAGTEVILNVADFPASEKISCYNTLFSNDTLYPVPDGTGASVSDVVHISGYPAGNVFSAGDLERICVNMEHSWMRDLEIKLICPSGASVILHNHPGQFGGEVFLGEPFENDEGMNPVPGVGYTYCWEPDFQGLTWLAYADAFQPQTLPPGTYRSFEPLSNLDGCPLNGDWTLEVTDLWAGDNGILFSWELELMPKDSFEVLNSLAWENDPSIVFYSEDSIVAQPEFSTTYQLNVANNFGCENTWEYFVETLPDSANACLPCDSLFAEIEPDTLLIGCDDVFPVVLHGNTSYDSQNLQFSWFLDSNLVSTDQDLTIAQQGQVVFSVFSPLTGCLASDTLEMIIDKNAPIANAGPDTTLPCPGTGQVVLDGSQSSAGPNIMYEWFDVSGNIVSMEQTATVTQPGLYLLKVTDTSNGCFETDKVVVTNPAPLNFATLSVPDSCDLGIGQAGIIIPNPPDPVSYLWSNGDTTEMISGLISGTYEVQITYGDSCQIDTSIFVDTVECLTGVFEHISGLK